MKDSPKIDMTEGPILSKLLLFSVPIIFSGLLQLLFNAADIIVVGRFAGHEALAAVGSTASLINLLINLFVGLSVGTNVVAANFFGAKKSKSLQDTVHTAILLSIYSGIILTVVGIVGAKKILQFMSAPDDVLSLAALYLKIYFGGITATMIYNFGSALLRAKGDTQRPLVILFLAGLVNVILNLVFVILFKMGVAGVAFATIISQSLAAIFIIVILIKETDDFKLELNKLSIDRDIFFRIVKVGVPAGFQGIMFSFSNVIIQSSVNSFGAIVMAGNSAAMTLEGFVYTAMNGFAQGTLTFTSQNYGAQKYDRIKNATWMSILVVIAIGNILGWLVVIFSKQLLGMYSPNEEVIESGCVRLAIICSTYCLCGMMDVIGNILRGIGHSILPMVVTMTGACGIRILWLATIFQIEKFHTTETIYYSYPISWFITFTVELFFFLVIFDKYEHRGFAADTDE